MERCSVNGIRFNLGGVGYERKIDRLHKIRIAVADITRCRCHVVEGSSNLVYYNDCMDVKRRLIQWFGAVEDSNVAKAVRPNV